MNEQLMIALGVLLACVLVFLMLFLFTHGGILARVETPAHAAAGNDTRYPGIDPAACADTTEQQAALDCLCRLPQFRRLPDDTVIDWGSGAQLTFCDCPTSPVPHLMVSWGPHRAVGLMTKQGLAHYVAYQERVADALLAGQAALPNSASGAMGPGRAVLSTSSELKEAH